MGQAGAHTTTHGSRRVTAVVHLLPFAASYAPLGDPAVCASSSSSDLGTQALRPAPCRRLALPRDADVCVCNMAYARTEQFNRMAHGALQLRQLASLALRIQPMCVADTLAEQARTLPTAAVRCGRVATHAYAS
mgnify:CR=1 FL=1